MNQMTSPIDWEASSSKALLNPRLPSNELNRLQELTHAFAHPGHLWIASSGSSSSSENSVKMIALSRSAFLASAKAVNEHLQSSQHDIWAQVLPSFHVGGLGIYARAFLSGAKVVDGLLDGNWSAAHFLKICDQEQVSLSALVPTQIFDLVSVCVSSKNRAPSSLRALIIGGAALSDELYHQALDLGFPLLPSYGMTETCSQVATATLEGLARRDRRLQVLSHCEVQIEKRSDNTNDTGILQFRGASLLTGYAQWKKGEKIFVDPKKDGWLSTEDLGRIEGQTLIPLGRDSDFVKISGEGVHLSKLNEILNHIVQKMSPAQVQNVLVLAMPDERTENRIELVMENTQFSAADILHLCQQFNAQVAPYEKIRKENFVFEIPRSPLGKVLWAKLREQLREPLKT